MLYYLFTDGSSKKHLNESKKFYGGAAYVLTNDDFKVLRSSATNSKDTTNNKMELTAFIYGIIDNKDIFKENDNITIVSDSKYLVDGATRWMYNWIDSNWTKANGKTVSNLELWKLIHKIVSKYSIEFIWIKAHTKSIDMYSKMNAIVDEMAGYAMRRVYNK